MIELLEPRVAPAIVFTYTDLDGDLVKVTISKGNPGDAIFTTEPVPGLFGDQLVAISLNGNQVFKGANITITATPQEIAGVPRGDGIANIGFIGAAGIDLGKVKMAGDLGRILAGDIDPATAGVKQLNLGSLGVWGTATGPLDTASTIKGSIPVIKLAGDWVGSLQADRIGSVTVGGDMTGILQSAGRLSRLNILGAAGGSDFTFINVGSDAGRISVGGDFGIATLQVAGKLAGLKIGGTVSGFNFVNKAAIIIQGDLGPVQIGGNLSSAAVIFTAGKLSSLTISGSVLGNFANASARIFSGVNMGPVKIAGDFVGGSGVNSAQIVSEGPIASVKIGGSMIGGPGDGSAQIFSRGDIGKIMIGGNLEGGAPLSGGPSVHSSAYIEGGRIGSIFIGGSIVAASDFNNADAPTSNASIRARDSIGSITVLGSILGNNIGDDVEVIISARGERGLSANAKNDVAIGKITVGGGMEFVRILAGYDPRLFGVNADAQIGTIKVGGDVISSNIIAGVQDNGDGFGNFNDTKLTGMGIKDNPDSLGAISRIAKVIIKGAAIGTISSNDAATFGIEAQSLGVIRTAGTTVPLQPGAGNDLFLRALPLGSSRTPTGDGFDFHAFEVPVTT